MNNPTQASWEQALLNKMTSNGERLAVIENKLESIDKKFDSIDKKFDSVDNRLLSIEKTNQKIESLLGWLKWIAGGVGAILLSIIANFIYTAIS